MKFKFCPECGYKFDREYKFCPECGANLNELAGGAASAAPSQENKTEPKAEKFKFEFSEDTAGLAESFDKQLKEKAKPKVPAGILSKDEAGDLFAEYTKDSLRKAFSSIKYYAESGDAEFQNYYASYYDSAVSDNQDVVKASDETAFYWYKKSAEQGFANSQFFLGEMYYEGIGCTQNKSEGLFWLKKAAQQGECMAKFYLEDLNIKL